MNAQLRDRTLALAGMFQAAHLAQSVARRGMAPGEALGASIDSVFELDAATTDAVYGGAGGVADGLRVLASILGGKRSAPQREVIGYVRGLMRLERRIARSARLQERLRQGIEEAADLRTQSSPLAAAVMERLAEVYRANISPLAPRIMVRGDPVQLTKPENTARVRALLLAGIRSAVLWRQKDGSVWQLLFGRGPLLVQVRALLSDITAA